MVASSSAETAFEITYCVRGYHVYRPIWDATLSETLVCGRKAMNEKYRYKFAVKKSGTITFVCISTGYYYVGILSQDLMCHI